MDKNEIVDDIIYLLNLSNSTLTTEEHFNVVYRINSLTDLILDIEFGGKE